ncbi:hypothetical protein IQ264_09560 [Phormidium sp. LEGE 05292]|uniref:hypothetical protein n=1 Tax=[Phormidium] sp. LEGE 05292 TaxID=767427 RepID=UPI00187F4B70|nr:hypothetical protein [Phormidium sp. LEGE 05292]MBE9225667.1 hypothetical protein [Phormidium sp. LEGE 05292]
MKQIAKVLTIVALTAYTVGFTKSEVVNAQPTEPQLLAQALITYQGSGEITLEENGENRTVKISRVTVDTRQAKTAILNITTDDGRRYALVGRITENTETGGYKVSLTTIRAGQSQQIPAEGVLAVTRTGEISPEGDLTYTGTKKLLAISFTPTTNTSTGTTEPVRGMW